MAPYFGVNSWCLMFLTALCTLSMCGTGISMAEGFILANAGTEYNDFLWTSTVKQAVSKHVNVNMVRTKSPDGNARTSLKTNYRPFFIENPTPPKNCSPNPLSKDLSDRANKPVSALRKDPRDENVILNGLNRPERRQFEKPRERRSFKPRDQTERISSKSSAHLRQFGNTSSGILKPRSSYQDKFSYSQKRKCHGQVDRDTVPGCPQACRCKYDMDNAAVGVVVVVVVVDCSDRGLIRIPTIPSTAREVYLQRNKIQAVPCGSFMHLSLLRYLDLSHNKLQVPLANCSFDGLANLQSLRLSECHLSRLPFGGLDALRSLVHLDLSLNNISSFEEKFFLNMRELQTLSLLKNNLAKLLNRTFDGLVSLTFLSLQSNMLRYLPETFESEAFQGLSLLETLNLQGNNNGSELTENLHYPDEALSRIGTLRHLMLDGIPKVLGPGFSSLVHLSYLDFSGRSEANSFCSMLSEIPPTFFAHISTKEPLNINMSSCGIHAIPPELFTLVPTIHTLDLSLNDYLYIEGFEKGSQGLQNSNLSVLNITHIVNTWVVYTEIRNTTFQYLRHTKLKILVVEDCRLFNIEPRAILDLPNTMEYVSFKGNKISNANALLSFFHLSHLKVINICNQLVNTDTLNVGQKPFVEDLKKNEAMLPMDFPTQNTSSYAETEIKILQMERERSLTKSNPGTDMTKIVLPRHINSVEFCDDTDNRRGNLKGSVRNEYLPLPLPRSLEEAYASNIRATYNIPRVKVINNDVLKYFDYSANGIHCFGGPIYGMSSLQYLDLSRNYCYAMNPLFFSHMLSLTVLLLYKNTLGLALAADGMGVTFSKLDRLQILDLSNNVIQDLSETAFDGNGNLQILNLSSNEIRFFRPSLAKNRNLHSLDLSFNSLAGLSQSTCQQLQDIRASNANFTVQIKGNKDFVCDCDNLYFLQLLLDQPQIFEDVATFQCRLLNGSYGRYAELAEHVAQLRGDCLVQTFFVSALVAFFLLVGGAALYALYHFKRWQWKYLYYVGRSRLHLGSTRLSYRPVADVFLTYDQDNRSCRSFMRNVFLPRLHHMGVSTVLGEVDFDAGPQALSIAAAVTSTGKTVVFFSKNIFQDSYRQLEVNLAIMHELHLRTPVVVPVLLLRPLPRTRPGRTSAEHSQCNPSRAASPGDAGQPDSQDLLHPAAAAAGATHQHDDNSRRHEGGNQELQHTVEDDRARFKDLVRHFPPEIATFLKGQMHRCLIYDGDTENFWQLLRQAVYEV